MNPNFGKSKNNIKKDKLINSTKSLNLDFSNFSLTKRSKEIKLPKKLNPLLAYEIGTSLGDGCLPKRGKSYRIKGNLNDEKEFYNKIMKPIFKELYNIDINPKEYRKSYGFEIYSKALVEFKTKVIGLPKGNKKYARIPKILKVNNRNIIGNLLSGLFDTDGTIFFRSQGKNKKYYPSMRLTTISQYLAKDIQELLKKLGFKVNLYQSKKITKRNPNKNYEIVLYGYKNFKLFRSLIGTKQPKNIDKIKKWEAKWSKLID